MLLDATAGAMIAGTQGEASEKVVVGWLLPGRGQLAAQLADGTQTNQIGHPTASGREVFTGIRTTLICRMGISHQSLRQPPKSDLGQPIETTQVTKTAFD
jgi:hypothetical protein